MVQAYQDDRQEIPLTIMSFDKNVHRVVIPIVPQEDVPFKMSEIEHALIFFTITDVGPTQLNGQVDASEETVAFVMPKVLRGYTGSFGFEVDIQLSNDRSFTLAQFRAYARISDADTVSEKVIQDAQEYYFELFEEWSGQIKDAKESATKEIDKQVSGVTTAATAGKTNITSKVNDVEKTKTDATKSISDKVAEIESFKKTAQTNITKKVDETETSKKSAQSDMTKKVGEVETEKKTTIEEMKSKLPAVEAELATVKKKLNELDQSYADQRIYGIKIDHAKISNNVTRLEDAAGMVANVASDTSGEVRNDFDKIYPWKNEFTKDAYGNEFRKIRLFYIKYVHTDSWSKFYVSMTKHDDTWFALPCFTDYSKATKDAQGREQYALLPYVEIGRYLGSLSSDNKLESKPNAYVKRFLSRVASRNYAVANNDSAKKLAGYQIEDQSTIFMMQVLFMVEFATTNSQSVMQGETDLVYNGPTAAITEKATNRIVVAKSNTADKLVTLGATLVVSTVNDPNSQSGLKTFGQQITKVEECGATGKATSGGSYWSATFEGEPIDIDAGDNLFNATHKTGYSNEIEGTSGFVGTNNGRTPMVYRGVEALWGSIWRWYDGLNLNGLEAWICEDVTKFSDNKFTGPDYAKLSYDLPEANSVRIKAMGFDPDYPFGMLPIETGTGSYEDNLWANKSGQFGSRSGGYWYNGSDAGLFAANLNSSPSSVRYHYGCRLVHKAL